MSVPKEILDVQRPKNTIVYAYGKNKDKYAVRQRIGCKYVDGRRLPVTGATIGHIVDSKYVPLEDNASLEEHPAVTLKAWADVTFCDELFQDVLTELMEVYSRSDALRIYCISILRVCNPGIKDHELKEAYDDSFLSEIYPDVANVINLM